MRKAALTLSAILLAGAAFAGPNEPAARDPIATAKDQAFARHQELGLTQDDLREMRVLSQYRTAHNGVFHVVFRQQFEGVDVFNGDLAVHLKDDEAIAIHSLFVRDLANRVRRDTPALSAESAVERAANRLGLVPQNLEAEEVSADSDRRSVFNEAGVARAPIAAHLVYVAAENDVRLAWNVEIQRADTPDWMHVRIDAETGAFLDENNWTNYDSYLASPWPAESLGHPGGAQTVEVDPADPIASPFGWHDVDGVAGAEFTDTQGNNVTAQEDTNANNTGGIRPDGGAELQFNFAYDVGADPTGAANRNAAVVNLFYWNNVVHDVLYRFGFDEAAGNFQINNYGRGGVGGDAVVADAQDGSGTNNANFATPPDGFSGRMQMFIWLAPPDFTVNSPAGIAGIYEAGSASFGPELDESPFTGDIVYVDDGDDEGGAGSVNDGCQSIQNDVANKIALIDRGACEFGLKVLNAENAGAIGAVVVNNQGDFTLSMGPGAVGNQTTISSVFIGQSDGQTVKDELPDGTVNATGSVSRADRDSDFDNGIIAHEYGHGVSNRLTGGPSNTGCLDGSEQMGEGWSDLLALIFHDSADKNRRDVRGVGNYVAFADEETGPGIRNFPYSTRLAVHPQTYSDIASTNAPHGVGEIWAATYWEAYWNLRDKFGFQPLENYPNQVGGNAVALQLLIDGMKLQPCLPDFVSGRDAILLADEINYDGDNRCEIWRGFAKRGVGVGAAAGTTDVGDEIESFDLPAECPDVLFSDGFRSGDTAAWSNKVP